MRPGVLKVTMRGKAIEHDEARLSLITFKGYWADVNGTKIDKISFGSTVRFYIDKFWAYDPKLKISIKSSDAEEIIVEDTINKLNPLYFVQREQYFEIKLKKKQEYKSLQNAKDLELCCGVSNGFWRFVEQEIVAKIKISNSTFDGKFSPKQDEVYIDIITPFSRDREGLLVVFNDTEILFKTHSLCRGSNSNRTKAGGNGDTPTGRASTMYNGNAHKGEYSYGNFGLIYLIGNTGEFLTATQKGRAGIAIHAGHTSGYYNKSLEDKGMLLGTYGCVRVYNAEMEKLAKLYTSLKNSGKTIYCYIEDYHGNISDVYKAYGMGVDPRDRSRGVRIKTQ